MWPEPNDTSPLLPVKLPPLGLTTSDASVCRPPYPELPRKDAPAAAAEGGITPAVSLLVRVTSTLAVWRSVCMAPPVLAAP
jgi:hypothetical protein